MFEQRISATTDNYDDDDDKTERFLHTTVFASLPEHVKATMCLMMPKPLLLLFPSSSLEEEEEENTPPQASNLHKKWWDSSQTQKKKKKKKSPKVAVPQPAIFHFRF
jgi:hypothetical protein